MYNNPESLKELFKLLVRKAGVFNDGFNSVWIKSFVIRDSDMVGSIRHSDVFAIRYNFESRFTECPDSTFNRDISKEHSMQKPLLHKQWHLLSLLPPSVGMF